MSTNQIAATKAELQWNGIHHIALSTADIDTTASFYKDVLGMPVSDIFPSREGRGRHCLAFVKPNDSDTWGFHFFERASTPVRRMDLSEGDRGSFLLHIALRLLDSAAAEALRERLRTASVEIREIPELGSFLFSDNNGILLEATWPKEEGK